MKALWIGVAAFIVFFQIEAPALANHRQSIRVAYPSLGLPQAPLWIASAANYFNEAGLRVESLFIQNSSTVIQSLLSDEIDFAMVGPAPVIAVDLRGADIVMIATTIPTLIFYVIARPDIQKIEDLKGKSIGFGRFGSNTDFAARLLLEKYGLVANKDVAMIQTVGGNATVWQSARARFMPELLRTWECWRGRNSASKSFLPSKTWAFHLPTLASPPSARSSRAMRTKRSISYGQFPRRYIG